MCNFQGRCSFPLPELQIACRHWYQAVQAQQVLAGVVYVQEYFPDMSKGPHAQIITAYFLHMEALLVGGLVLGDVEANKLKKVTAKVLYEGFTTTFPPPKVVFKFDTEWSKVWGDFSHLCLSHGH